MKAKPKGVFQLFSPAARAKIGHAVSQRQPYIWQGRRKGVFCRLWLDNRRVRWQAFDHRFKLEGEAGTVHEALSAIEREVERRRRTEAQAASGADWFKKTMRRVQ